MEATVGSCCGIRFFFGERKEAAKRATEADDASARRERCESVMEEIEAQMSEIVGQEEVKSFIRTLARGMLIDESRMLLGMQVARPRPPHMAFLGNPGTGKTMVARALGSLYHMVGVLPTNKVVEVQRTDLVGEFIGHTGPKTRKLIQEAEGGILFVDEAYRLVPFENSDAGYGKDFGLEALEEIMSVMDNGSVAVIFAGYAEPMKRVINSNEGFSRRVTKILNFDNFSTMELAQITHLKMNHQDAESLMYGFRLHEMCTIEAISELLDDETTEQQRQVLNGGLVWPMLVNARANLDRRLDLNCCNLEELMTITLEDIQAGLRAVPNYTRNNPASASN